MPWQLRIVDGADQGRTFPLPDVGITTIGSSRKHADIHLNDLYVARIHGELDMDGGRVMIAALDTPTGTLVNNQKVRQQELHHGDVVRMGNSHLRLEDVDTAAKEVPPPEEDIPAYQIEVLDEEAGSPAPTDAAGSPATTASATAVATEPPKTAASSQAQALPANRLQELTGHTLAHFQVEEVRGTGHGGVVFQAHDIKTGNLVALKVLAPDFPHTDAEMQRFVQVWKAVLPLRHANLVPLYGVGKTGPYCWLAMELIECASLPAIIERLSRVDTIDWHRPYRIAVQIGRALAFAHEHGMVHRNVTARHVLWHTGDKVAKLADLGLAAALQGSNLKKLNLRDKLQNDLVYFSPEQTEPDNFIDGVCDIYSLGVVVYALLTGRYPHTGASQAEIIRNIREAQPTRLRKLQPDIPKRLDNIVMKMLAKRQEDRYQTANEVLADLQIVGEEEDALV